MGCFHISCLGGFSIDGRWEVLWHYKVHANIKCGSINDSRKVVEFLCIDINTCPFCSVLVFFFLLLLFVYFGKLFPSGSLLVKKLKRNQFFLNAISMKIEEGKNALLCRCFILCCHNCRKIKAHAKDIIRVGLLEGSVSGQSERVD